MRCKEAKQKRVRSFLENVPAAPTVAVVLGRVAQVEHPAVLVRCKLEVDDRARRLGRRRQFQH